MRPRPQRPAEVDGSFQTPRLEVTVLARQEPSPLTFRCSCPGRFGFVMLSRRWTRGGARVAVMPRSSPGMAVAEDTILIGRSWCSIADRWNPGAGIRLAARRASRHLPWDLRREVARGVLEFLRGEGVEVR